jgi:hypothetical protein
MRAEARSRIFAPRALARAAVVALLLAPAHLGAQEVGIGDSVTSLAIVPTTTLQPAFYDGEARRDPFDPLTLAGELESGPRFETLRLTGVFLGSPGNSLVVLEDPTRRGHFLRVGERLGEARLVQILPESAVFEVEEYGTARRVVLRLERNEENP